MQFPNAPLLVAMGGRRLAAATGGSARAYARAASDAGLAVWGWRELTDGANPVRRMAGASALAYVVRQIVAVR